MTLLATLFVLTAGLTLFSHAAVIGAIGPGVLAPLVVSGSWILIGLRAGPRTTAFLVGFVAITAVTASSGSGFLLPAIALISALHGWDASLAAIRLRGFSRSDRLPIIVRYAASSVTLAVLGLGLVGIASSIRVRFSFGIAVGLALGFFALSTAVGLLSRPARRSPMAPPTSSEETE